MKTDNVNTGVVVLMLFLVVLAAFTGAALNGKSPVENEVNVDTSAFEEAIEDLKAQISDLQEKLDALYEEAFAEDVFKDEAQATAEEYLSDDKNEQLADYIQDEYEDLYDVDDINEVEVLETDVDVTDLEDKKAEVTFELKVSYEEETSTNVIKRYITATVVIEDGEAVSISFE